MQKLTDGMVGVVTRKQYRVEIWITSAPKLAHTNDRWCYFTKIDHGGYIGERSIGLPLADVREIVAILEPELRRRLNLRNRREGTGLTKG